jgi:glycosyltransferase involved in cell wall biosynthesis
LKLLFFTENLRAGGKERRIIELLKNLKSSGEFQIELVLTRNIIHYEEIYKLDIPIHIIERKYTKKDPLLFFKFFKIANKFKPDIIHVWGHMVAAYSVPTKLLLGVPLINNEIVDATLNKKLLGKSIVFKISDRVIANTYAGLKAYGAPMEKSRVIYNGFTFDRIKNIEPPEAVRTKFAITTQFVIGMVASFLDFKDYDTYINSALKIVEQRNDVCFLCIGDGDDSKYKKIVGDQNGKNILFLGRQSKVESIMNICDIGVLTTNIHFHGEGISNALMEFMAVGKPVITTNFGGSPELIEENVCGYLIDAFSEEQLMSRINHLLNDEQERKRIGQNGMNRIREKFSMEAMFNSFKEEYVNALKKITSPFVTFLWRKK